jgi:hypothetical protein
MKQAVAKDRKAANTAVQTSQDLESATGLEPFSYAKELRALGQALEQHHFSFLDLEIEGGIYVIRGKATALKEAQSSFSRFVRDLIHGYSSTSRKNNSGVETNLRVSPEEIDQLDSKGRLKRKESHQLPDPYSISQILRGAGSYLDNRDETSLVGITIKDQWVTIRYKTAEGRLEQAKQDLEYFYNYWVKMYLRRSNRPKLPHPSEPSLIVTWQGINKRGA